MIAVCDWVVVGSILFSPRYLRGDPCLLGSVGLFSSSVFQFSSLLCPLVIPPVFPFFPSPQHSALTGRTHKKMRKSAGDARRHHGVWRRRRRLVGRGLYAVCYEFQITPLSFPLPLLLLLLSQPGARGPGASRQRFPFPQLIEPPTLFLHARTPQTREREPLPPKP